MSRGVKRRPSSLHLHQRIVRDVWGERWYVYERRPTRYGFAVYTGRLCAPTKPANGGYPAVIVTAPLAAHIRANAQRPYFLPLPIGDNARRRIRKQLGVDHRAWIDERLAWWFERIDDLATLPAVQFVAKHGAKAWTRNGKLSTALVCQIRLSLLGRKRRPRGWWKSPAVRALVNSALSAKVIGDLLQVSHLTVYGIRQRVQDQGRQRVRR